MEDIFNIPTLYVTSYGTKYEYNCKLDFNGLPNYYPGPEKSNFNIKHKLDEVLFLPIKSKNFKPNRFVSLFGYKYIIYSSAGMMQNNGSQTYQILIEIRRFRYKITSKNSIIIDRIFDPLHVPRGIKITNNNSNKVGLQVINDFISNLISENNSWYLDKTI